MKQAEKLQKRAARVGFDWTEARDVIGKVREGRRLRRNLNPMPQPRGSPMSWATCCLPASIWPASPGSIRAWPCAAPISKFDRRFRRIEALLAADGRTAPEQATLEEMETLWVQAKTEERANG